MQSKEQNRERNRQRRQSPEYREKQREWYRRWHERNAHTQKQRSRKAEQMRAYTKRPEVRKKIAARWKTHRAINAGRLIRQPCVRCGEKRAQAHHHDYDKPLSIVWLCAACHRLEHAKATK